ncbi:carboxypeptidase-like regulatory domain-containing protein [Deinococcus aquatilis]|uniref:carboxypeptidase-like regulatory domain-containing protein n=1 Tax=Deinococcus aquatilis TaxID=519440 RepID=UPI000373E7CC|nr:carboxypeptidase-like regulatory domain-containing protein [Deinococcus aquatilis]
MTPTLFRFLVLLTALSSAVVRAASVTGQIVDTAGQPVKHATVIADNTLFYNTNVIGYTDSNGRYKLDISRPVGTWNVTATVQIKYGDYTVDIEMIPTNPALLAGTQGGVRNFTFKPQPATPAQPYGSLGWVIVNSAVGVYDIDETKIELTLTPVGKLADGSAGRVIKGRPLKAAEGALLANVMWGTYRVTASYEGRPLQISRRPRPGEDEDYVWGSSYTGPFVKGFYLLKPALFLEVKH